MINLDLAFVCAQGLHTIHFLSSIPGVFPPSTYKNNVMSINYFSLHTACSNNVKRFLLTDSNFESMLTKSIMWLTLLNQLIKNIINGQVINVTANWLAQLWDVKEAMYYLK